MSQDSSGLPLLVRGSRLRMPWIALTTARGTTVTLRFPFRSRAPLAA